MSTIQDAISAMRLSPDDDEAVRCIARIPQGKKPIHATLRESGGRPISSILDNLYVTVAKYKPGTIHAKGGRTKENAVSVEALPFDADLSSYLGRPASELHGLPHDELDTYIQSLAKDAQEVFDRVGIPIHRIDSTGYGIALYVRLHGEDAGRIDEATHIHKRLVERINACYGGVLVDPAVSDPATRLMRVVGSQNHKGPTPRVVFTLSERDGAARLDQFAVAPPVPPSRSIPVEEKRLDETVLEDIVLALGNEYGEGNRNSISHGLPAMLVKAGVPLDQAEEIIERVAWDDEELDNRLDAVRRTYLRWEQGLSVSGYRVLINFLTPHTRDYIDGRLNRHRQLSIEAAIREEAPLECTPQSYGHIYEPPPLSCFYGWFGEYRHLMAPCTSGADAFHLAAALVYAGATIGKRAYVYQAQAHYPNLMAVLVGDTGRSKKDTCADLARRTFAKQETAMSGSIVTPTPYNVVSGLSTAEGLLEFLNTNGPRAVIHSSEFNIMLGKARRDSGHGLIPTMTALWDEKEHIDLPTRKDPIRIQHPFVSLISTVTPYILARDSTADDIYSGFANRVLWIFGSGKGRLARPPKPDAAEQSRLIREFVANVQSACGSGKEFTLSPQANQLFDAWDKRLYEYDYLNEDELHLSERLEGNAIRIALIFAASDGSSVIHDYHLQPAIDFLEWQFENVRKEARLWGSNDDARLSDHILTLLKREPLTKPEIYDRLERYGAGALERTIKHLYELEKIVYDREGLLHAHVGRAAA